MYTCISINLDVKEDGDDHEEHAEGPAEVEGGHADGVRLLYGVGACFYRIIHRMLIVAWIGGVA
jgi:hypothetical protein